jgi:hypothetical protein
MDKATLVNIDLQRGADVLDILQRADLKVSVALWMYTSEYAEWRLILSGKAFDSLGLRDAYRLLNDTLHRGGIGVDQTPTIMILPISDPFIKGLRRIFGKAESVEGMRLGGQMIGDRFVEEAYVYRIS